MVLPASTIPEICKKLENFSNTFASEADVKLDAKIKLIPPFFTNDESVNMLRNYIRETELTFFNTRGYMIYQFLSDHEPFFVKIKDVYGGKYAPLTKLVDMFRVFERSIMELQKCVYAQMLALENKRYEEFFTEWHVQQEISLRLDRFFEAQGEIVPFQNSTLSVSEQKKEVKIVLKRHGIARAAAMIALTIALFFQGLMPSVIAASSSVPQPPAAIHFAIPNVTSRPQYEQKVVQMPQQSPVNKVQNVQQKESVVTVAQCADFTKYWEGFRSVVYKDSLGFLTIGYGTCIDKRIKPDAAQIVSKFGLDYTRVVNRDQRVSPQTAQKMLESEIAIAHAYAFRAVKAFPQLNPYAQRCVVDMIYNLGVNGFLKFKKMIAALEVQDYATAALEMKDSRWFSQTKQRAEHHFEVMQSLAAKLPVSQTYRMAA